MFSRDSLNPIPRGIGIDLAVILPARGVLARGPLREIPSYILGSQGWSRFNCARNLALKITSTTHARWAPVPMAILLGSWM